MATLTARAVEAAKPKGAEYKLTVDMGLYLCVYPTGVKRWLVRFVLHGKQIQTTLPRSYGTSGDGDMTLAQACVENDRIQNLARSGVDFREQAKVLHQQELEKKTQQEIQGKVFSELFKIWIVDGVARSDGNAELLRSFEKDVLPVIGKIPIKDISENELRALLKNIIKRRGVRRMAVRLYHDLVQLFGWAEKRQPWRQLLVNGNPADLIDIQQIVGAEYDIHNIRERILSPDEIRELLAIFRDTAGQYESAPTGQKYRTPRPVKKETQLALWICLSTVCRIGELLMTPWKDVDLVKGEWFIPKANVKGRIGKKQDHLVFLSALALSQFKALHALTGSTPWCFPNEAASSHVNEKAVSKQVGDRQARFKQRKKGGLAKRRHDDTLVLSKGDNGQWTPNDLRRTAATMMQSLKVSPEVVDRCQNHILKGSRVRRHYLHYDYAEEKKEAWERLGKRLEEIFSREVSL